MWIPDYIRGGAPAAACLIQAGALEALVLPVLGALLTFAGVTIRRELDHRARRAGRVRTRRADRSHR